ncbi:hypothetical protein KB20921_34160 [Edwardsiella ictaluri]|nr:hypothetical protein KH20906_34070 [Edwardsiella ictaluri]BEI04155.1 hypothetical protein KB20921_34160 [Edwardsiella ictaluri]BEI07610.1 hypothetical protein KH201010_33960 [Edwardsiella ictaluri]BEI11082.1 hypothetical protein STU22726_34130 [Edwardsiella ictaluri]BEI14561.1 hypothetical protein STU22816_34140 [Edwardsiella ictaluri]
MRRGKETGHRMWRDRQDVCYRDVSGPGVGYRLRAEREFALGMRAGSTAAKG